MKSQTALSMLRTVTLLTVAIYASSWCSEITDLKVFSEKDYARLAFKMDGSVATDVEINNAEKLVFIKFDGASAGNLPQQSYLLAENPHVEAVSFLPLGDGSTVARVKVRHPFKMKTFQITDPPTFVLELSDNELPRRKVIGATSQKEKNQGFQFDYYTRGLEQVRQGSNDAALISFRSAIRSGIHVSDSYYHAGVIRLERGEYDKAAINFNRASQGGDYSDQAMLYKSWTHYLAGNTSSMKNSWKEFTAKVSDPTRRMSLAANLTSVDYRSLEEAATPVIVKQATETRVLSHPAWTNEDSAAFYYSRAMALKDDGHQREALKDLERSVEFYPAYSQAHFQMGVIYKSLGMNDEAGQSFALALHEEKDTDARESVPEIFEENNEPEEAIELAAENEGTGEIIEESENEPTLEQLSALAIESDESADSLELLTAGITNENKLGDALAEGDYLAAVSSLIAMARQGKLRRELWLLTIITGILFGLAILGERLKARKKEEEFEETPGNLINIYDAGGFNSGKLNPAKAKEANVSEPVRRKMEVEAVLAKTLNDKRAENQDGVFAATGMSAASDIAAEKTNSQSRTTPSSYNGRSHDRTAGNRPVYGADIAARIREELSSANSKENYDVHRHNRLGRVAGDDNDMRVKLIRQLRDKQWSIADISQELGISREEVRWAMNATSDEAASHGAENGGMKLSGGSRDTQARSLVNRKKEISNSEEQFRIPIDREQIDKEVDLELQINV